DRWRDDEPPRTRRTADRDRRRPLFERPQRLFLRLDRLAPVAGSRVGASRERRAQRRPAHGLDRTADALRRGLRLVRGVPVSPLALGMDPRPPRLASW